ncbi:MAG: hypothetical protein QNJ94_18515 [Alphaproteobacteria bacterium]|nr:hypothetical protein [Alphaproteobacteria bacterium]
MQGDIPAFGFNPLDTLAPTEEDQSAERLERQRQEWQEAEEELNGAIARMLSSADGRVVRSWLARLRDAPTFDAAMGTINGAAWGFFREGQNNLLREMERREKAYYEREV